MTQVARVSVGPAIHAYITQGAPARDSAALRRLSVAVSPLASAAGGEIPQDALQVADTVGRHQRALDSRHWLQVGRAFLLRTTAKPIGCGVRAPSAPRPPPPSIPRPALPHR